MSREWIDSFITKLQELDPPNAPEHSDRATLAYLRRGLAQSEDVTLARLGWLFIQVPDYAIPETLLIAGLFATHSAPYGKKSLGAAFHSLRIQVDSDSVDKRFVYLVDSSKDDLPNRLRHTVKLLKSKEIPINYAHLLRDVMHWDHPERYVQWQWSRDYWQPKQDEAENETAITISEGVAS